MNLIDTLNNILNNSLKKSCRVFISITLCIAWLFSTVIFAEQGGFYTKKNYSGQPIPSFSQNKNRLPKPIFDDKPEYIDFYYRAWQIGFEHFKKPQATSPFVSNFIDEAFNDNIFLWGMGFSTMWGNYAHHIFPSIEGLDNFYRTQKSDGEIVREVGENNGITIN